MFVLLITGGVALYELNPAHGTWVALWDSEGSVAAAEASWPRFSIAQKTGMIVACLEGPEAPRELWAAEYHRDHKTIVEVTLRDSKLISPDDSQDGKSFVVYEIHCQGLLRDWKVARRFAEFVDLREQLIKIAPYEPPREQPGTPSNL